VREATVMTGPWLLYGANGYTGELIARKAASRGHHPVLAGRHAGAVSALAEELSLERRLVGLDDPARLDAALAGMSLVLHCAGPFSATWRPMAEACLRTGTHYLDLSGEVEVLEALVRRDDEARQAGVMLLPGCGFEVVASDCLAAHLKARLPGARRLALGRSAFERVSRGTALTAVEGLGRASLVRREGALRSVPSAWRTREIDFGTGPRACITVPLADLTAAWRSTGIGNVEVYLAAPPDVRMMARAARWLGPLLASNPVQRFLKSRVRARPRGPSEEARRTGRAGVWGEAEDDQGRRVVSRLVTPEGYTFTARAALAVVEAVLGGQAPPGFQTPSLAFGADLVLAVPGVTRTDEPAVP
jgi:short subunit dehydrogenase-like uncharacterized protein